MNILLIRNIFSNLGDEAMLRCEIEEIKNLTPKSTLTILTDNPEIIRRKYEVDTDYSDAVLNTPFSDPSHRLIHKQLNKKTGTNKMGKLLSDLTEKTILPYHIMLFVKNAHRLHKKTFLLPFPEHHRKLLRHIQRADLIIGGGGLIPSIKGIYLPKKALYQAIQILEKPLILHGQSILPSIEPEILQIPKKIILRDHSVSRRNIKRTGAAEENLIDGVDPAFTLQTKSLSDFPDSEILKFISQPFIALNLRGWKKNDF